MFQQVSVQSNAHSMSVPLSRCDECYALVQPMDQMQHESWHRALALTSMQRVTSTTIVIPPEELRRLQYWVDALFVFLGEEPKFLPEWDESGTGV